MECFVQITIIYREWLWINWGVTIVICNIIDSKGKKFSEQSIVTVIHVKKNECFSVYIPLHYVDPEEQLNNLSDIVLFFNVGTIVIKGLANASKNSNYFWPAKTKNKHFSPPLLFLLACFVLNLVNGGIWQMDNTDAQRTATRNWKKTDNANFADKSRLRANQTLIQCNSTRYQIVLVIFSLPTLGRPRNLTFANCFKKIVITSTHRRNNSKWILLPPSRKNVMAILVVIHIDQQQNMYKIKWRRGSKWNIQATWKHPLFFFITQCISNKTTKSRSILRSRYRWPMHWSWCP